jgi:ABC transporter substrate binding protein
MQCSKSEFTRSPRRRAAGSRWALRGPSERAVCRLRTNSNLVDCMTGRSAGFFEDLAGPQSDANRSPHPIPFMRRRDFIMLLGGAAAAWPLAAHAQQKALPVIGFVNGRLAEGSGRFGAAFRRGVEETGYIDGQNVTIEYHWLEGRYDRLPALLADLVRRRVAVIATPASTPATLAAKAASPSIPIVFGVGEDPVKLGLVASLARPGGNVTGVNFFLSEVTAKRLGLLHDLVPKAVRVAVLVNPANAPTAEATLRDIPEAARAMGLQIQVLKASTSREIETAFATLDRMIRRVGDAITVRCRRRQDRPHDAGAPSRSGRNAGRGYSPITIASQPSSIAGACGARRHQDQGECIQAQLISPHNLSHWQLATECPRAILRERWVIVKACLGLSNLFQSCLLVGRISSPRQSAPNALSSAASAASAALSQPSTSACSSASRLLMRS